MNKNLNMKKSNIITLLASLILIFVFFLPLWNIALSAPQYPEGLGLYIYINKIKGHKESDLKSINGLNHYIGMKEINPDSIPELKIIPFFIIFMIIFGIFLSVIKNRWLKISWVVIFILGGIVGLIDFYLWEYDYGHNLDPHAIIKIPGMSYQPPLIGSKQLLNFNAASWPDVGFIVVTISVFLFVYSIYLDFKNDK